MIYYHYTRCFFFFWLSVPAHQVTSMVTVEKGPQIILFYQILFCICCEFFIFELLYDFYLDSKVLPDFILIHFL